MSLHASARQIHRTFGRPLQAALFLAALQSAAIAYLWINHWPPVLARPFFPRYDNDFVHTFLAYGIWISDACFITLFCTLAVGSRKVRVVAAMVAYCLLAINHILYPEDNSLYPFASFSALVIAPSVITLGVAVVLRRAGLLLERHQAYLAGTRRSGFQFSIRDIFGFTASAALLIVACRLIGFYVDPIDELLARFPLFSHLFRGIFFGVLYAIPCIPVALSILGSWRFIWRLFAAAAAAGFVEEFYRRSADDFPLGLILVSAATTSSLSALLLRHCGYRLRPYKSNL